MNASAAGIVGDHVASGGTLGVGVVVERAGREERLVVGEADVGVPLREDAIFLWLSAGKPVTAMAIACLYEQGMIKLDDPVAMYLLQFPRNGKQGITIRQLLTHTAGLHKVIPAVWELADWQAIQRRICEASLPEGFVPGEHAAYDPAAGWFVLAQIVQAAAQMPFEQFVKERIFAPCGMMDAAFSYSAEEEHVLRPRLVQYFNTSSGKAHLLNWNHHPATAVARPGASLRATLEDMVRFYRGLLAGRVVRPETLALFASPQRGRKPDRAFGIEMDWGLGVMVANGPGMPYSFGPGATERSFGHGGQQSSLAFCDSERELIVAVAYNGLCGERQHARRMNELLTALGL